MQASASAGESPAQLKGRVALARSSGKEPAPVARSNALTARGGEAWNEPVRSAAGLALGDSISYRGSIRP